MNSRPRKQRKLTVPSSDSDPEPDEQQQPEQQQPEQTIPATTTNRKLNKPGPTSNLVSSRSKALPARTQTQTQSRKTAPSPGKQSQNQTTGPASSPAGNLRSFFPRATDEQRWSKTKFESTAHSPRKLDAVPEDIVDSDGEDQLEEGIEDDYDSYDEIFAHFSGPATGGSSVGAGGGLGRDVKRDAQGQTGTVKSTASRKVPSKPFLMPQSKPSTIQSQHVEDTRPWAQRFAPRSLDELAVHKKKVADVRAWLEDVFSGRNPCRLLVLRGPAGCGKTTTLSLLSKSLGFDIVEWRNPSASEYAGQYSSVGAQFEEFLGRGNHFGGLDLDLDMNDDSEADAGNDQKRVLLVEEFPTILSRTSASLAAFRSSFQRYLAAAGSGRLPRRGYDGTAPIVIIVSETLLNSASSVLDNLTVHRLLGPEIYNHPGTTVIDFNSIAPTFMHKALQLILDKESRSSRRSKPPRPAVLKSIADIGDIRSAISSLEFLCLKGETGGFNKIGKGRKPRNTALTAVEKESLKLVTQREASLGIFHAVGKIVYNKRDDPDATEEVQLPPPPDHLRQHDRPKVSQVAVNELVDETGTDIQTFICALHENYPPSCNGSSFTDCLNGCIDALSDSDILCPEKTGFSFASGSAVDNLRQHDMSYQVATRGLLFALSSPVKRWIANDGRGHGSDAHKMLFPNSVRLWRERERVDGLIDVWTKRLLSPSTSSRKTWKTQTHDQSTMNADSDIPTTRLSRDDMLLYQLPYMTKILREGGRAGVNVRELDTITVFHGIASHSADDAADGFLLDSWLGGQDPGQSRQTKRREPVQQAVEDEVEKLVLSDDDIVDD